MVKPTLRTKSIGTKVSEEEYALLEHAAQAESRTLGEWCRHVMLSNANGRSPGGGKSGADADKLKKAVERLRQVANSDSV